MTDTARVALALDGASFGYGGETRVQNLTLDVPTGAAVALIGPNGSGKSTLLRGILGLADLTGGAVRVLGEAPAAARRNVGTLPQSDARDTSLPVTVRTVVGMGLYREAGAFGRIGKSGRDAIATAIRLVGLEAFANRIFGELSGGQQQRAILARALVSNPRLLLLDEPFNGLDRENREMLLDLVARQRDEGRTVIVSTHDLEIAKAACTHVLLLASGHEPGEPGHPAAFGTLEDALTLDAVQHAFHDSTVELDQHTVTTTREVDAP
ncbi:metal ABC transporter ATP-binding protein [Leucobacter aridicollis]|uniref:ABC-type Mn2+/Zn2+ transport system ATPase subunit n=1 Tax=Leucobacter aridicollis TaxID=283878 RepID=A0A852R659_9MICO|nr:ABC transporter ATP-binding protein [Leucobacter aridicollis]MBL3683620.1 ABC transporter ATP-binding protein [Leucobacter aridicollis]NYD28327.1 ABC-type Mn2+/Zn2+ transport system ATPase subunit [Leucobacter aridicollis]